MTHTRVGAVVPAAGLGTRFGSAENKIWSEVCGRAVIEWTLSALNSHPALDVIVLSANTGDLERLRHVSRGFGKVSAVVSGGASRQESVGNGLAALSEDCDLVLVHDAARPAVSHALISRVIEETERSGAAVPGLPVTDTLKRTREDGMIQETVARAGLWAVQTPQGARLEMLRAAYAALGTRVAELTDEAGVLEAAGYQVRIVAGEESNLKVTHRGDLTRASAVLAARDSGSPGVGEQRIRGEQATPGSSPGYVGSAVHDSHIPPFRVGFGYDVHRLAAGRELWLGGVRIPHDRGLAGHSDADALLHAVCDALVGAAGLGDIGVLFPDSDPTNEDRPSVEFLREISKLLESAGWRVLNVDVSLLAEAPRIGPYRATMAAAIASALDVGPGCVNIKATTSESMGFVGRREGIACWAVATIQRR